MIILYMYLSIFIYEHGIVTFLPLLCRKKVSGLEKGRLDLQSTISSLQEGNLY